MIPRMRTAEGALKIIKEQDPDTGVTLYYLRGLIKTGAFPSLPVGKKKLINVDKLIEYLRGEQSA